MGCKHRGRYGVRQGKHGTNLGAEDQAFPFYRETGSLISLSMVLAPTPTLLQLERKQEGKGISYLSLQLLLFFECLCPNVKGPKAVPKAGGAGASLHATSQGGQHISWGFGGHLVNSQKTSVPRRHSTWWSLKSKSGPTGGASKAGAQQLPRTLSTWSLGWAPE